MLSRAEINIMASDSFRRDVEENLDRNPVVVALDKRISHAALVASQIKYLRRAKDKLPSYYEARCILPPLAFEQSSGERAAAHKGYAGKLCIDLTCGLGVDSLWLSKKFDRVISLERDPILADLARINFGLLGASNIEVVNSAAEDYIANTPDLGADLVYVDPDRRARDGRKLVRLEDCSPNIVALYPSLAASAKRVAIKCSPMFDIDEAFRLFGRNVRVEVISAGGENKEMLIEISRDIVEPVIAATVLGKGSVSYPHQREVSPPADSMTLEKIMSAAYLVVPDVALQKARVAVDYYRGLGILITDNNGFAYAPPGDPPNETIGRIARIDRAERYNPKRLKGELKTDGIRRIDILKRNFAQDTDSIARQLGVSQGGSHSMAFTVEGGTKIALSITFLKFAQD